MGRLPTIAAGKAEYPLPYAEDNAASFRFQKEDLQVLSPNIAFYVHPQPKPTTLVPSTVSSDLHWLPVHTTVGYDQGIRTISWTSEPHALFRRLTDSSMKLSPDGSDGAKRQLW